jgi:hypothetical protein
MSHRPVTVAEATGGWPHSSGHVQRPPVWHGITGVQQQIEEYLAQLVSVRHDVWQVSGKGGFNIWADK